MDRFLLFFGPGAAWRVSAPCSVMATRINGTNSGGIHGSLKASVPNKTYNRKKRKTETGRMGLSESRDKDQPCAMRADWSEPGLSRMCRRCFSGTGSLLWCPVFSPALPLLRCQFACLPSLSVCFFSERQPSAGQPASARLSFLFITGLNRVLQ